MAVSHVKSNIIPDATGTVTVFNSLGVTQTRAASDLLRPSDWNSAHNQFLTLGGNTAGASTMSGSNIIMQGGANVTLSANGDTLVFSAGGGGGLGISAGTQSVSTGTMIFANSNGMAFGMSGSSQITGSYSQSTHSHATAAFSGSNGSFTANTVTFGNLNGLSFYTSNGSMVGSHNALTTAAASDHSHGNPTLNLTNLSGTTASNSAGLTLSLSAAAQSVQPVAVSNSAGSFLFSTLNFSNANGVTFGTSAGGIVTASVAAAGGAQTGISGLANSETTYTSGSVTFSALGAITIRSTTGQQFQFSVNAQSVVPGIQTIAFANTTFTTGGVSFSNANGISFGSSGAQVTASHNALTSQSNQNVTAGNGGFAFQTLSFSNVNGISFGTSAGSAITASHNAITTGRASTDALGLATAQTNVTWTANSAGVSFNAAGYAGTTTAITGGAAITMNSAGFQFNGAGLAGTGTTFQGNNASGSMTLNSAGLNLSVSVAAPGAAAENNWIHLLGANTAGNTTASGTTIGLSGLGVTLSGTNGSVIVVSGGGGGAGVTFPGHHPYDDYLQVVGQVGQGSLIIDPQPMHNFAFDRVGFMLQNTNSSNSSGSHTLSFWMGLYTRNASTLSLHYSMSGSTALTHSGTVGSYSLYSGRRVLPLTVAATTITENKYWIAVVSRTTSGGANGTYSNYQVSNLASNFSGVFGSSTNATYQPRLGQGFYSATTSGLPNSIAFTQIQGTNSLGLRMPIVGFHSGTV